MPKKNEAGERLHGGPGASHEDATEAPPPREKHPKPGQPTNTSRSKVSGGGGERDRHHTHDPATKA